MTGTRTITTTSGSTVTVSAESALTQDELVATLCERFGDDPLDWAFVCPHCGDVATGGDVKAALAEHPRTNRDGLATSASDLLGQECIGRTLGALSAPAGKWSGRGCDWAAYGLFSGPAFVGVPDGKETRWVPSFRVAPAKEGS